ncbi:MAG TPA: RNA polymerase subunit sigma-70 [Anaerovibrio sp.]|uniref:sugar-binding transcriptional regulator n=1 Tax=Anaerovibrio lipolyticus TaxID=82374 RepID=UPI000E9E6317|nr:sugar-binding transcriptional regulator [Anaerovibrio lipolyticus]MBE6104918.1 sugar-binding transcriptional regulator [Anaerovibrio lipolyticus]HAQ55229.1 RNA polymerase subunit sigma-70 [Anaerovibrio sp.]HCP95009.1 RNA polymerase subunit sigma-70 [Anaerovibrio sp.]
MTRDRDKLSINVAKLYYRSEYSQQRIAEELGISRPSVSRLLQYAKDKGYVKIQIMDPVEDMSNMEQMLVEKYHLHEVRIASSTINDENEIKKYIGIKAAEYLDSIVQDGDMIGVGWGTTLYEMSCSLLPRVLKGSQIVQLEGGVTHSKWRNYAKDILENFSNNYSTIAQYLPLPVVFGSREVKEMVDQDRHIKRVLEMGSHANIAVFGVGTVRPNALFFRLGYTDQEEQTRIQQIAVGDICSRFFDADGRICNKELDARTVGITLDELRNKEHSIMIAGGEAKVPAIRAALKGHYANVFITDQFTAKELLKD